MHFNPQGTYSGLEGLITTMRKAFVLFALAAVLNAGPLPAAAQKYTNNWLFGANAGIDFNTTPPSQILNGALNTSEGCSSVSDPVTGQLLFYTNGDTAWNRNNQKMPNGIGLGGHRSSSQSALIVPDPGDPNKYYLFTVFAQANEFPDICCGSGGLNLNTVDMTLDGGLGDVVIHDSLMLTPTTEKLCAVKQCNGRDYWVVVHQWNTNNFYAYPVTAAGIGTPVITAVGMVHEDVGSGTGWETIGYMRISPDGSKLALATNHDLNRVEIFGFDNQTGVVGPLVASDGNFPNVCGSSGPYGVCFSPDGSKLYVSYVSQGCGDFTTEPSELFQYDLNAGTGAAVVASRVLLQTATVNKFGALQLTPDGEIYVAKAGDFHLDVVQYPNLVGAACGYVPSGFLLNQPGTDNVSQYGLPNVVESFLVPQRFRLIHAGCSQADTLLVLDTTFSSPYTVLWNFGDPSSGVNNTSTLHDASHNFSAPGSYNVALSIFMPCDTIVVTKVVESGQAPTVMAGNDTTLCAPATVVLQASGGNGYTWSPTTGLSCAVCDSPTATPLQTTTYTVSTGSGTCLAQDSIVVTVLTAAQVEAASSVVACGPSTVQLLAAGASSYVWSPPDGLSATDVPNPMATVIQNTTYTVIGSIANCIPDTAVVSVIVAALPVVDAGLDTTIIVGQSVQLSAVSATSVDFAWSPSTALSNVHAPQPLATPSVTTSYTVTVTDTNGCTASDAVLIFVEPDDAWVAVPTAFSPNGDGFNDVLRFYTRNVASIDFRVFNRWGEKVFETTEADAYWDGTFKNAQQGLGVFVYDVTAVSFSGKTFHRSGNVTLIP